MKRLTRHLSPRRAPRGGTLIEVLVSVLVLAIGLLGAAALHTSALRNNQSNYEHAQMTLLTQGMFDAMLQAQINPGACGRITCTARDCTVGIQWDDARATGGASAHSIEVRGRL